MLKPKHSALLCTPLPVPLYQLRIDALLLAGVKTDSCILATAMAANMREYRVRVPRECTAAIVPERKSRAIALLKERARSG